MDATDSLKGLTCLVTGGAQGIGFATASECARRGASIMLLDRQAEAARSSADQITARFGVPTSSAGADVADPEAVGVAVQDFHQRFGRIDVLVNCAGIMTPRLASVSEMAIADVEQMLAVHVKGAYLCAQSVLPGMTARGFGRIINISSVLGTLGLPFRSGYAIAKSAINGFTRSLAVEVARAGVTVNAVAPGYILTETLQARLDRGMLDYTTYAERAPAGRWGLPEEVGHLIAFLALPASGFITGAIIAVDGGYTIRGDPGEEIGPSAPPAALEAVRALFGTAQRTLVMVRTSIHAAVWGPDWTPVSLGPTLDAAARIGYDCVVIPLRRFADIQADRLAREFEKRGLAPLNTCGLSPDQDIGDDDEAVRKRGVAHLTTAIGLARDMGSSQIGGVLYGPLGKASQPLSNAAFQRAAEVMRHVAERAQAAGIRLALEVVNRYETRLLYNTARGLAFLDAVGHPNVLLHLDTFHMSIDEASPLEAIVAAAPRLAYFELDQSHRGPAFEGSLDLVTWCKKASSAGYRGLVGVEAFSRQRLDPDHANALAIWQERFSNGDQVAEEFMQVIRAGFED